MLLESNIKLSIFVIKKIFNMPKETNIFLI